MDDAAAKAILTKTKESLERLASQNERKELKVVGVLGLTYILPTGEVMKDPRLAEISKGDVIIGLGRVMSATLGAWLIQTAQTEAERSELGTLLMTLIHANLDAALDHYHQANRKSGEST